MAEGLLIHKIPEELKDYVIIRSAGTLGLVGNRATPFAITAAGNLGANISNHRSSGISEQNFHNYDLIFALDHSHKAILLENFPEAGNRIFLLKEYGLKKKFLTRLSIADPIGGSLPVYEKTAQEINAELDRILPDLIDLIKQKLTNNN